MGNKSSKVRQFFIDHWYLITIGILLLASTILLIIGGFIKVGGALPTLKKTDCIVEPPNANYMANVSIGSNTAECPNDFCCPDSTQKIPVIGGTYINSGTSSEPNSQLCYKVFDAPVCDQDAIVTDIKVVEMQDKDGNYAEIPHRCCDGPQDSNCRYSPPVSIALPLPSGSDVGTLPNSAPGCNKMGICVSKQPLSVLRASKGQYLSYNNVKVVITDEKNADGTDTCTKLAGTGYVTDGTNLYQGCNSNASAFLCKKYSNIK